MTYFIDRHFRQIGVDPGLINPASYDLTIETYRRLKQCWRDVLGNPQAGLNLWKELGCPDIFNPEDRNKFWDDEILMSEGDEIMLLPQEPILFSSKQWVKIFEYALGILFSKSTFGRALVEHLHAGLFDPGFEGKATFEVINMCPAPVILKFDQAIVQMVLLFGPQPDKIYQGRYQSQTGAEPARKKV